MSGGLTIEVAPAGEIMPALGVFDACSQGTVESFMGASLLGQEKRGLLTVGAADLMRLRHNPFYAYQERRVLQFVAAK